MPLGRSELLSANGLTGSDGNDIADVSGNRRGRGQGDLGPNDDAANCNSKSQDEQGSVDRYSLICGKLAEVLAAQKECR